MEEEKQIGLEKELLRIGKLLLGSWWMILISALVVALCAIGYTAYQNMQEQYYQSTTQLYVQINDKTGMNTGSANAVNRVNSYCAVMRSRTTMEEAITKIRETYPNYNRSAGSLVGMVSTSIVTDTEIFKMVVTSTSKEEAYLVADAVVKVMQERIPYLFGDAAQLGVVDTPVISSTPVAPPYKTNAIYGALIGALLCCAVIILLDLLNDKLKSEDWLTQNYGGEIPILASIPDTSGSGSKSYRYYSYKRYGYYYGSHGSDGDGQKQ